MLIPKLKIHNTLSSDIVQHSFKIQRSSEPSSMIQYSWDVITEGCNAVGADLFGSSVAFVWESLQGACSSLGDALC